MAANLTPEYQKNEARYKSATTDEERLDALQAMLQTIPKHKASEKMQAELKRKISQLRKDMASKPAAKGTVDHFHVPKSGAGQVVLAGPPNTGKSSIVAVTTNAPVKVGDYPYTTALPAPGMWPFEDVQIQLVDTPPMTVDNIPSGLLGTIRSADIIGIVVDASADCLEQADMMHSVLTERGVELKSVPVAELDVANPNARSAIVIANKLDLASEGDIEVLRELFDNKLEIIAISTASGQGLDVLRARLWQLLSVIRIYTKEPGKPADFDRPYILPLGSTVEELASAVHRDLPEIMTFARIWGDGWFEGQRVQRSDVLHDKNVVEIHQ